MRPPIEFMGLFQGNQLAYGGDEGRAVRCTKAEWQSVLTAHWDGTGPAVGVYPLVYDGDGGWGVRWGCVDFDIKSPGHAKYDYETEAEAAIAAENLQRVLAAFGVTAWIERTRSHGRHVWIFCVDWLPAKVVREALLVATEIAGVSQREVNPKSDGSNLTPDQLGNYVRLPCHGERVILQGTRSMPKEEFVTAAREALADRLTLERVATLYRPPAPTIEWNAPALDEYDGTIPRVVRHVIENGPNDGDRSKGLLYIAHECMKAGLSPKHALDLVSIADDVWGKYTGRRDREQRLIEIVERAWG